MPDTSQGCRPISVTIQPAASVAIQPEKLNAAKVQSKPRGGGLAQGPRSAPGEDQHENAHAHHDAKRQKHRRDRRIVVAEFVQAANHRVGIVAQDDRKRFRDFEREIVRLRLLVDEREERERRAFLRFPERLDRGDLRRLVLERIQPVQITDHDLDRHERRGDIPPRSVLCADASCGARRSRYAESPAIKNTAVMPDASSMCASR